MSANTDGPARAFHADGEGDPRRIGPTRAGSSDNTVSPLRKRPGGSGSNDASTPPTLTLMPIADLDECPQIWLSEGLLALGTLAVLCGPKGAGKSTLATALAAALTGNRIRLPGRKTRVRGKVLWFTREEDPRAQLKKRLKVNGADMKAVMIPGHDDQGAPTWMPSLPRDWPHLDRLIREHGVKLLVMDTLTSFVAAGCDLNDEQAARRVLEPGAALAAGTGCLILLIRHPKKGTEGDQLDDVLGSVGIGAVARTVLAVRKLDDPPGRRVVLVVASNLHPQAKPRTFDIKDDGGAGKLIWRGEIDPDDRRLTAEEVHAGRQLQTVTAVEFLERALSKGPRDSRELKNLAFKQGLSDDALWRAAKKLGVKIKQIGLRDEHRSTWARS